jgi:hypothetical protein
MKYICVKIIMSQNMKKIQIYFKIKVMGGVLQWMFCGEWY